MGSGRARSRTRGSRSARGGPSRRRLVGRPGNRRAPSRRRKAGGASDSGSRAQAPNGSGRRGRARPATGLARRSLGSPRPARPRARRGRGPSGPTSRNERRGMPRAVGHTPSEGAATSTLPDEIRRNSRPTWPSRAMSSPGSCWRTASRLSRNTRIGVMSRGNGRSEGSRPLHRRALVDVALSGRRGGGRSAAEQGAPRAVEQRRGSAISRFANRSAASFGTRCCAPRPGAWPPA